MEKKYQIFISSTYEDLKRVRDKVIYTILSMNQIPVGMELFSAADEDQWEIIQETIDASDYYVLIVGRKYGTIITSGPDAGISYTEKEFNYALSKGVPVFAFLMDNSASVDGSMIESDPAKLEGLTKFTAKVKDGRLVKFWKNSDELCAQLSQTLYKAMARNNRPGWVRATAFNIEESHAKILELTERVHTLERLNADLRLENQRKPDLSIQVLSDHEEDHNLTVIDNLVRFTVTPVAMSDVGDALVYNDAAGNSYLCPHDEVKLTRHICQNCFSLKFQIHNTGNAVASNLKVCWHFPDDLLVLSTVELLDYIQKEDITFSPNAYKNWDARFFAPEDSTAEEGTDAFIPLAQLTTVRDIAELLDPAIIDDNHSIFPGEVHFKCKELQHFDSTFFRGIYLLPTRPGDYEITCTLHCNEMAVPKTVSIDIVVE